MSSPSDTLLLGTRKGCLLYQRSPSGWKLLRAGHVGAPIPYAFQDHRTGHLWASIDHGHWGQKLSRSRDLGRTWEEVAAPAYPEDCDVTDRFDQKNEDARVPATLRYLWVLAPGGDDQPERMYAGTEPGGLFRSDDGGDSWELVRSLWDQPSRMQWFGGGRDHAGIHSVVVDPRDSRRVLVGISCAGVFESSDDCATWTPRNRGLNAEFLPDPEAEVGQDPHFMTLCPAAPDTLWQQNHCGIYRSEDFAGTWTEVSEEGGPARFGFPVAVDANDPRTAWVVPATSDQERAAFERSLCVCRTEDGGASWQALREGLPQGDSWDVVWRHALDVSAERLAFGSTTGNVYVSDDRGDSWEALGHHLPPVHSVRFVRT